MKRFVLLASFGLLLCQGLFAQTDISKEERIKRSTEILTKMRKIDLLNQILPVLMDKKQLNEVMGAVEKAQINVEKNEKLEYAKMAELEKELDSTIQAGIDKNELPAHAFVARITKVYTALSINRQIAIGENVDTVRTAMKKVLNAGQLKAAENAIDATFFDPSIKPEDLTDARKLDTYIKVVMLDPVAYSILTDLYKAAK